MMAKHSINDDAFVAGWKPATDPEQKDFKGRYYFEKMNMTPIDKDAHYALRKSYMEGLMWCLAYYYKGCISWGWFYPYHYGKYSLVNRMVMNAALQTFELTI
jgi:5'-3' exonuclease